MPASTAAAITAGRQHETVNSEVSAAGSFEPKTGRVVAGLTAGPPSAGDFSCPNGQTLVLASVAYTQVTLTDDTNGGERERGRRLPDTRRHPLIGTQP